MPILVVTKLLFGNYLKFVPIYHIKKVPSNILYFGHSVDIKIKLTITIMVRN